MTSTSLPPEPFDAFVGRGHEAAQLREAVRDPATRLVTVTGVGGVGKTRLALRAAADVGDDFPDGVIFVDLSQLADHRLVATAIADAVGIEHEGGRPVEAALREGLAERELLLILDNFEHLLEAAPLVTALLGAAPGLAVLATSREPLRLSGERVFRLDPLPPPVERAGALEDLAANPAVALFCERARAADRDFALTPENGPAVAEICRRLDGLPLAIELAAARVRHLSVLDLRAGLSDVLDLLSGGPRDRPERQRTIRATIGWTYDLLPAPEREALARLSIFIGGFAPGAAHWLLTDPRHGLLGDGYDEAGGTGGQTDRGTDGEDGKDGKVGETEGEPSVGAVREPPSLEARSSKLEAFPSVLSPQSSILLFPVPAATRELLATLVDHGLIRPERGRRGATRYAMLETIRQFGLEQLQARGEEEATRWSQARLFLALGERAKPELSGKDPGPWLDMLDDEWPNLRVVLAWVTGRGSKGATTALGIGNLIWEFWKLRSHVPEGKSLMAGAHSELQGVVSMTTAESLLSLGRLEIEDLHECQNWFLRSLEQFRQLDDLSGQARALGNMGMIAVQLARYDEARALLIDSLGKFESLSTSAGVATACYHLGCLELTLAHFALAQDYLERARDVWQQLDDTAGVAYALLELGRLFLRRRQPRLARDMFEWSHREFRRAGILDAEPILECEMGNTELQDGRLWGSIAHFRTAARQFFERGTKHQFCASALEGIARIALRVSQHEIGVVVLAATETWRRKTGHALSPDDKRDLVRALETTRDKVTPNAFSDWWLHGELMTLDQAFAFSDGFKVLQETLEQPQARDQSAETLTRQELTILCMIATRGLANQQIASALGITIRTVTTHVNRILGKLGVDNRTAAAAIAYRQGMCE